ncbi:MAG: FtsB family cell division protein [Atribacter sp.]|jgi:cell division protein FtsB|uniref:FtsB family cell division protein n=1 Tax=Atribacter sp. TaxID=2847780 RepID=UPI003D97EFA3
MVSSYYYEGKTEPDVSHKIAFNWRKILFSIIFALILLSWCFGFTGKLIDYYNLLTEEAYLTHEEKRLYESIEQLNSEKQNLNQDWYIEKLAREKLNLAKPGEVLIKVVPSENP